jgi:hypothetical protein
MEAGAQPAQEVVKRDKMVELGGDMSNDISSALIFIGCFLLFAEGLPGLFAMNDLLDGIGFIGAWLTLQTLLAFTLIAVGYMKRPKG